MPAKKPAVNYAKRLLRTEKRRKAHQKIIDQTYHDKMQRMFALGNEKLVSKAGDLYDKRTIEELAYYDRNRHVARGETRAKRHAMEDAERKKRRKI